MAIPLPQGTVHERWVCGASAVSRERSSSRYRGAYQVRFFCVLDFKTGYSIITIPFTGREVTLDLSFLDQIRRDAADTRDSLLTEEAPEEQEALPAASKEKNASGLPLDAVQIRIVRALLDGEDPLELLKAHHLMPSMAADSINEALLDRVGDTVLLCEEDHLMLVDDYIEELEQILGGTGNG